MNKRISFGFASLFFALILLFNASIAKADPLFEELLPTKGPWMNLGDPEQIHRSTFSLTQTPFLFLQFNQADLNGLPVFVGSIWYKLVSGGGQEFDFTNSGVYSVAEDGFVNIWQGIGQWSGLTDQQKLGNWHVTAGWFLADGSKGGFGSTNFTVTPEPISSALFLLGGAALIARKYHRRKQKV